MLYAEAATDAATDAALRPTTSRMPSKLHHAQPPKSQQKFDVKKPLFESFQARPNGPLRLALFLNHREFTDHTMGKLRVVRANWGWLAFADWLDASDLEEE